MKTLYYILFLLFFTSCCYEYFGPRTEGWYRVVNSTNGQDLVFGPNSIYNKDSIKFFSISGSDTIIQQSYLSAVPNSGSDSMFVVYFSSQQREDTVYIRLNNSDIDTMQLTWKVDDSKCSKGAWGVSPYKYNNRIIDTVLWVAFLRK